jgi:hypothetical protein
MMCMASFWLLFTLFDIPDSGESHISESAALTRAMRLQESQPGFQFVCIRDEKKNILMDPEEFMRLVKVQKK